MDTPLAELADALQRFRHGGVEEEDLSTATQMGLRAALVRRFLTDQLEFVNIAKEYLDGRGLPRAVPAHRLPAAQPRPARRQGGRPATSPRRSWRALARVPGRARRDPPAPQLAHPLGRHPRLHPPQRPRGRLQPQVHRPRPGAARLPVHRPALQELVLLRPTSCAACRDVARRPRGPAAHRAQLEPARGPPRAPPSRASTRACSSPTPARSASGWPRSPTRSPRCTRRVFSPDPIEYRAPRGLLDLHEEMGILIQEVVGTRSAPTGCRPSPAWASRTTSSAGRPRIKREDGLLRIVPGLGTRAVDRLADDYPVLIAPGQPGLRVNQTPDEALRYSPEEGRRHQPRDRASSRPSTCASCSSGTASEMPLVRQMISIADHDHLRRPVGLVDFAKDDIVVTFEGLLAETARSSRACARCCRSCARSSRRRWTSSSPRTAATSTCCSAGPRAPPRARRRSRSRATCRRDRVLFTAHRYVSNGQRERHQPRRLRRPGGLRRARARPHPGGRARGRPAEPAPAEAAVHPDGPRPLGQPRRHPPGRAASPTPTSATPPSSSRSRAKKGGYLPDLSFGTHFFQDLVESNIRYLPLYPDDPDVVFNEAFFQRAPNALAEPRPRVRALVGRAARDRRAGAPPTAASCAC